MEQEKWMTLPTPIAVMQERKGDASRRRVLRRRGVLVAATATAAALALTACGGGSDSGSASSSSSAGGGSTSSAAAPTGSPIKVGMIVSLTGAQASSTKQAGTVGPAWADW